IKSLANVIPVNGEIFIRCLDIKQGKKDFSPSEIKEIFKTYLTEVRKLWEIVDKMEIENKEAKE
ncbi:MAG TPA: hypothetical protein VMW42_12870, partial [Desulfatiglandales bacterium]|nr:hypothetical protein [Desulfatiglandales bacterium]